MDVAHESRTGEMSATSGAGSAGHAEVRPIRSARLLAQMRRDRQRVYALLGVEVHDGALDAMRRFGTTVGLFVDGRVVGGFSCWRLSEALCSLGFALHGLHIERYRPERTVELASMYMLPEYQGRGLARALMQAGRVLIAGMKPDLLVAFGVEAVVDRYVAQFGFRRVGPPIAHPFAPSVRVQPLAITLREFVRVHFV